MKSCFFAGHRDAPEELLPELTECVEKLIVWHGVISFLVGNYGKFDSLALKAVAEAKKKYPEVRLSLLQCYHPSERPPIIRVGIDDVFYPPGMEKIPRRFAIVRANKYAIDHSDYLIAYAWQPASNAVRLLEYAKNRERKKLIKIIELPRQ